MNFLKIFVTDQVQLQFLSCSIAKLSLQRKSILRRTEYDFEGFEPPPRASSIYHQDPKLHVLSLCDQDDILPIEELFTSRYVVFIEIFSCKMEKEQLICSWFWEKFLIFILNSDDDEKILFFSLLECSKKIGEGVYGEVFMTRPNPNSMDGARVLKVMPIEGDQEVNGEPQKKFHEIISEIVISM